jgi:uncharacterized membrane protein YsdA (DUF1294 family)
MSKGSSKGRRASPYTIFGVPAGLLSLGGAALLWGWLSWPLGLTWLVSINFSALLFFGLDKLQAREKRLRVPERILHGLVLLGGSGGGLAGMTLFRHKIRKGSFQLVFWGIVVLQILGLCAWHATS